MSRLQDLVGWALINIGQRIVQAGAWCIGGHAEVVEYDRKFEFGEDEPEAPQPMPAVKMSDVAKGMVHRPVPPVKVEEAPQPLKGSLADRRRRG
jgi:hypothetical protein